MSGPGLAARRGLPVAAVRLLAGVSLAGALLAGCAGTGTGIGVGPAGKAEPPAEPTARGQLELVLVGTYDDGYGTDSAEITAYEPVSKRLFIANSGRENDEGGWAVAPSVSIVNLADPARPRRVSSVPTWELGGRPTSVAAVRGLAAVALEAPVKQDPGRVIFLDAGGTVLASVEVGALPDMVTFTPDGRTLLVANEGEANDDASVDPPGSVTLIDLSAGPEAVAGAANGGEGEQRVRTLGFEDFDAGGPRAGEVPPGLRLLAGRTCLTPEGPAPMERAPRLSRDLEPEYIAVSPGGERAYVSLQEANALAVIDLAPSPEGSLAGARIEALLDLGEKDFSLSGLDANDQDGESRRAAWPVTGLFQPDGIAVYRPSASGEEYVLTANEGEPREDGRWIAEEGVRVGKLPLDPELRARVEAVGPPADLGRLVVSCLEADADGDGDADHLRAFGARSFSVRRASDGALVWDSGDDFERAAPAPERRSDRRGPEPESVTVGEVAGRDYAFVGLEWSGAVMVYDLSDPSAPVFETHASSPEGHVSPEGLLFLSAETSPTGEPLLIAAHEVSGTVVIWAVRSTR